MTQSPGEWAEGCQSVAYMIITPGADDHGEGHCEFPRCATGEWEA